MAGAKEAPRQKMIGMMYLVLTALLALNVSKSILDAFVTIEENVQKSNIVQANRGTEFVFDVRSELGAIKGSEQDVKRRKLQAVMERMRELDIRTEELIRYIDELKLNILKASGENVERVKNGDAQSIIWKERSGIIPMRMNLAAVRVQDRYDESMRVLGIANTIRQPTGEIRIVTGMYKL